MPIYDYKCKCGHKFWDLKSIDKRNEAVCPLCGEIASIIPSAWAVYKERSQLRKSTESQLRDSGSIHIEV